MFVLIMLVRGLTRVVSTHATFATAVAALDAEPKLEYEALRWLQYVPTSYDAAGVRLDETAYPATPGYTFVNDGEYAGRLVAAAEVATTPHVFSCTTPRKRARPTLAAAASSTSLDATASATVIDDDNDDDDDE